MIQEKLRFKQPGVFARDITVEEESGGWVFVTRLVPSNGNTVCLAYEKVCGRMAGVALLWRTTRLPLIVCERLWDSRRHL